MIVAPPRTGTRGSLNAEINAAKAAPHRGDHAESLERRFVKGAQPKTFGALLKWYSDIWDAEVPTSIHKSEVWRDHGIHAEGGSKLGSPAWGDRFRRYIENSDAEVDEDGWFVRPMHAALSRIGRRWPLTARSLFAVAQSGYDWRGVATRGGWSEEMFAVYLTQALTMLWVEYRDEVVRLT